MNRFFCGCFVALAITLIGPSFVWAANLTVSPASGQSGARIRLVADRLSANVTYEAQFVGSSTVVLGSVRSNSLGAADQALVLPNLPAGRGSIRLRQPISLTTAASAPFTALSTMAVQLPSQAHAGQSIAFSASGLANGTLSVSYDGRVLFGPVAVSGGSFRGKLTLPRDRPSALPANVAVVVRNSLGRVSINQLSTTLRVSPPITRPFALQPSINPPASIKPGQRFPLRGTLNVAVNETPPSEVSAWMVADNGTVYPLASSPVTQVGNEYRYESVGASGGILSMTAGPSLPGRVMMGGSTMGSHGTLQLGQGSTSSITPLPDDRWQVRIVLRNPNGDPIPNALVTLDNTAIVELDEQTGLPLLSTLLPLGSALGTLDAIQIPATDAFGCPLTLARLKTDANGAVTFLLDDNALSMSMFGGVGVGTSVQNFTVLLRPSRLLINAGPQGYGDVSGGDFTPRTYDVVFFGAGDGEPGGDTISIYDNYVNAQSVPIFTGGRSMTFNVTLPVIMRQMALFDKAMLPALAVSGPNTSKGQGKWIFGPTHNQRRFPASNVTLINNEEYPTKLSVRLDPIVAGNANVARLTLDVNRDNSYQANETRNFTSQTTPLNCSSAGLGSNQTWAVDLTGFVNWKQSIAGLMNGFIEFCSPEGGCDTQDIAINFRERDLMWVANNRYANQRITLRNAGQNVRVDAEERELDSSKQLPVNPGYEIGRLYSETDHTEITALEYAGQTDPVLASRKLLGENQAVGQSAGGTLSEPSVGSSSTEVIPILDESFPLFYYVWGVPLLAGVEFGANFAAKAQVEIYHKVVADVARGLLTTLRTTPKVDMGLDFYIDIDVLFDLVDGGVDLFAGMSLEMPVVVQNGVVQTPTPELNPLLIFSWNFEFFCLPLDLICDALNDISGSEQLLPTGNQNRALARPLLFPNRTHQAVAYSPSGGDGMLLRTANSKLFAQEIDGADFGREQTVLSNAPGIRSLAIAYLTDRRALAVWAENADSYEIMKRLRPHQRLARQRLMYATWDGENWSSKQVLTAPSFGEGGVSLAVCRLASCTPRNDVLAVWTRGKTGDLRDHRTEIMQARFNGSVWTSPTAVDSAAQLDSAPSAAYVGVDPYVAFVRSTNGVFADTQARRVAYRNLRSGSVQVPASLPGGVAWPSIQALSDTSFVIAHTHADDPNAFVGNTQRVALAFADTCSTGVCTVTAQTMTDANGRAIYGERPSVMLDSDSNLSVLLRGVGFSEPPAGQNKPNNDPIGMTLHTGELIQLAVQRGQRIGTVIPLSADGAGHVAPVGAFDAELGQWVAITTLGPPVPQATRESLQKAGLEPPAARAASQTLGETVGVFIAEQGMDLAVEALSTNLSQLRSGSSLSTRVIVRNAGANYQAGSAPWQLGLSFDAPYDAGGVQLGLRNVPTLASGAASTLSITATLPAGFSPDQERVLFATLMRADSTETDVGEDNNQLRKSFGGMPKVYGLYATAVENSAFIALRWEAPADPAEQIVGYRIWYHDGDGQFKHLGSSFELGFLDLSAQAGVPRSYRVTTYSRGMQESPPSATAEAKWMLPDQMLRNGFEGAR